VAFSPGERGRPARCLWPPAEGVCDRGMMLELRARSRGQAIRRDAEWKRPGWSRSPTRKQCFSCGRIRGLSPLGRNVLKSGMRPAKSRPRTPPEDCKRPSARVANEKNRRVEDGKARQRPRLV